MSFDYETDHKNQTESSVPALSPHEGDPLPGTVPSSQQDNPEDWPPHATDRKVDDRQLDLFSMPADVASRDSSDTYRFLTSLWSSNELCHQLGVLAPGGRFENLPVDSVADAVKRASVLSSQGDDAYFACAEFTTPLNRKAENAACARAFWADIDCGPAKAAGGRGYSQPTEARRELLRFCAETGLAAPTHTVDSGGGIHAYWAVQERIGHATWIAAARKLKSLMAVHGFLADPSRTADIASVLRVPGTLNFKYSPPRPVRLESLSELLDRDTLLKSIEEGHQRLCQAATAIDHAVATNVAIDGDLAIPTYGPPDLARLTSALKSLDPDCDESTWKLYRLAPLARAAREHPDLANELHALARSWSSGELREAASKAWTTPGAGNGMTGEQAFEKEWARFLKANSTGLHTTLGTIYHDAKAMGWKPQSIASEVLAGSPGSNPLDEYAQMTEAVAAMVKRVGDGDIGAPLEPKSLAALAFFHKCNPAESQRIRARLKAADKRLSLADLDAAVKAERAEEQVAPTHHAYAVDVIKGLTVRGFAPVTHEGVLYVIDAQSNIWTGMKYGQLEKAVAETHDGKPNCKRETDYAGIARHARGLVSDDDYFPEAPVGLACSNGFYRIDGSGFKIEPLTPSHRQRVLLNVVPQKQALPLFEGFLHETFRSDRPGEEDEQRALVQEIAGAILLGVMHRYQRAALFYDPYGRAGKGTLESILRQLVPPAFVTAVSPFAWEKEYFVVALAGARLNVVGELPENVSIPGAIFKSVIGGDLIMGRNPTHRPITFKNGAAHLFMSNHMITSQDQSEAFFARWVIVDFPNSRLRSGEPLDPMLASRIVEHEMAGIAHWALEGATRLLGQNGFSKSAAHERLMQKWRRGNSSLHEFIYDSCELGNKFSVSRALLYQAYKNWCIENGRKPFAKARVKELLEHNVELGITHTVLQGDETFRGVRLNPQDLNNLGY